MKHFFWWLFYLVAPVSLLTLSGGAHWGGSCFTGTSDPERRVKSSPLKHKEEPFLVLELLQVDQGAELASAEALSSGKVQGVID